MKKLTILLSLVSLFALQSCMSLITSGYVAEGDLNKDNALSFEEFFAMNRTKEAQIKEAKKLGLSDEDYAKQEFKKMDKNKDRLLTKKEILAYFNNPVE